MGRKLKKILFIIGAFIILWSTFFITDIVMVNKNKKPIFAIKVADYDDGGSKKYIGLFYNVYHVKRLTPINEKVEVIDYGYHLTSWFTSIDEISEEVIESK